jgi:hypothetical protein
VILVVGEIVEVVVAVWEYEIGSLSSTFSGLETVGRRLLIVLYVDANLFAEKELSEGSNPSLKVLVQDNGMFCLA